MTASSTLKKAQARTTFNASIRYISKFEICLLILTFFNRYSLIIHLFHDIVPADALSTGIIHFVKLYSFLQFFFMQFPLFLLLSEPRNFIRCNSATLLSAEDVRQIRNKIFILLFTRTSAFLLLYSSSASPFSGFFSTGFFSIFCFVAFLQSHFLLKLATEAVM